MQSEASLQEQIVLLLRLKGFFVYMIHQNVSKNINRGGQIHAGGYGYFVNLQKQGWTKGIPDLHVISKNQDIYIECKSKKGRISPEQQQAMDTLVHFGREVRVVNDISQIQDLLDMEI